MASESNSSKRSPIGRMLGSAGPAVAKVKSVNPAAAKTSATRGVTGTKELLSLTLAYVKQETKEPLSGIGRLLAFGLGGAVLMGFGLILYALALLRGIQGALAYVRADGERGPWSGSLTYIPYFLTGVGCLVAIGVIASMLVRATKRTKRNGAGQ